MNNCVSSLQLSEAGAIFGMVTVTLPALGTDQQFWYLCVREAGSLEPLFMFSYL